jgi:chemotaxis signal transduction protein
MRTDDGLLICEVGLERFAFRSRDVHHVERAEYLQADGTGDGRAGVLMLGQTIVPVFPLASVLGRPGGFTAAAEGHIAVTGDRANPIGWLVDRVGRTMHAAPPEIVPLPALLGAPAADWFDGMVRIDENVSALLISPQHLNPLAPATTKRSTPVMDSVKPALPPGPQPEPVAVVFSTTVLPPTPAQRYALSGRQIAAIVHPTVPIEVPGTADHVVGVMWWRRAIVPVIDFRDPADRQLEAHRRRVIAQCGGRHRGALVAFSIDAEVLMCRPDAAHRQLRDVSCPSFASGIFDINGESVALLNLDLLLETDDSRLGNGDAVLADLLVERAAGNAEPLGGPFDPPAFGV